MSKHKNKQELEKHRDDAIAKVQGYLNGLIASNNQEHQGKADKFSYWLEDYIDFLNLEKEFKPNNYKKYKRGEIIKAHLGYNIGSEEGGLHYCVVLDKVNSIYSPVLTIAPLTSVKSNTDCNKLHDTEVYLGNELFTNLSSKISVCKRNINEEFTLLKEQISMIEQSGVESHRIDELLTSIKRVERTEKMFREMNDEVLKMKKGSIALINQIKTISKIRIYKPKTNDDVLSYIKLSNEKLDMIDEKIGIYYTNLIKSI